jgi:DNA-binding transcriptional MerR regulator
MLPEDKQMKGPGPAKRGPLGNEHDIIPLDDIPNKLYFKIGEVAKLAGVEPYVLRYWETEFKEISPVKSRTKQRLYRRKDIDTVISIKKLLYQEGFTIDGARKRMREMRGEKEDTKEIPANDEQLLLSFSNGKDVKFLKELKKNLEELLKILET